MEYRHPLLATLTVLVLALPVAHESSDRCEFTPSATACASPQPDSKHTEDRQPQRAEIETQLAPITPPPVMPPPSVSMMPIIQQWWRPESGVREPPLALLDAASSVETSTETHP